MASAFLRVERRSLGSDMTRAYLWSTPQMDQSKLRLNSDLILNCHLVICLLLSMMLFCIICVFRHFGIKMWK